MLHFKCLTGTLMGIFLVKKWNSQLVSPSSIVSYIELLLTYILSRGWPRTESNYCELERS